jgi:septum formation protein
VRLKEVDEAYPPALKASQITDYLAELKAAPFLKELREQDILITADTIVWLNQSAIGKPKKPEDAKKILATLSGHTHEVISSVAVTYQRQTLLISDTTSVSFKKLSADEIDYYINHFKPFDKAGSYGIQEWIGYIGIEKIEGSYFNVMGFPVQKFYELLLKI